MAEKRPSFKLPATGAVLFILLLAYLRPVAQTSYTDTAFIRSARNNSIKTFLQVQGYALPVYQGREWIPGIEKANGHPFFDSPDPVNGSIILNGIEYTPVSLQYDLLIDGLVVLPPDMGPRLVLPKQKVDAFSIGTHKFMRPAMNQVAQGLSDMMYYRVLYGGPSTAVAHEWKVITSEAGKEIPETYVDRIEYFLLDGKNFRKIKSEGDLLELRGRKNKELRRLLSEQQISFRRQPERALVIAAEFYDRTK